MEDTEDRMGQAAEGSDPVGRAADNEYVDDLSEVPQAVREAWVEKSQAIGADVDGCPPADRWVCDEYRLVLNNGEYWVESTISVDPGSYAEDEWLCFEAMTAALARVTGEFTEGLAGPPLTTTRWAREASGDPHPHPSGFPRARYEAVAYYPLDMDTDRFATLDDMFARNLEEARVASWEMAPPNEHEMPGHLRGEPGRAIGTPADASPLPEPASRAAALASELSAAGARAVAYQTPSHIGVMAEVGMCPGWPAAQVAAPAYLDGLEGFRGFADDVFLAMEYVAARFAWRHRDAEVTFIPYDDRMGPDSCTIRVFFPTDRPVVGQREIMDGIRGLRAEIQEETRRVEDYLGDLTREDREALLDEAYGSVPFPLPGPLPLERLDIRLPDRQGAESLRVLSQEAFDDDLFGKAVLYTVETPEGDARAVVFNERGEEYISSRGVQPAPPADLAVGMELTRRTYGASSQQGNPPLAEQAAEAATPSHENQAPRAAQERLESPTI